MKSLALIGASAIVFSVASAAPAMSARVRSAGVVAPTRTAGGDTLQINNVSFAVQTVSSSCPNGSPGTAVCFLRTGKAMIPGLGAVTETDPIISSDDNVACIPFSVGPLEFTVAGKQGTLNASVQYPAPCNVNPGTAGTLTITGGSGVFANSSGTGTFQAVKDADQAGPDDADIDEDDIAASVVDALSLNLTAPNTTFDLTPPVISGAHSKTVRAPRTAKFARVHFNVTAHDNVDGSVPVSCKPKSGSRFKIGHTKVNCSAADSSANKATAKFTVTVLH